MCKFLVVLCLLALCTVPSRAESQLHWLQVKTDHFTVLSDGSDRAARHTAGQLERMHAVFAKLLPGVTDDPGSRVVVLALRDRKDFQSVEPAAYLEKNALDLAGLFLRGDDRSFILLRLDNSGDHPYETVYHEYTHYMVRHADYMPVWLNEGLAQFYQNTDIFENEVRLGQPNTNVILYMRQQRLIPLETLFQVDHNSPYYHEENKGSVFYGESWALTHYLFLQDFGKQETRLRTYAKYLIAGETPLAAAQHAFGDLKVLGNQLDQYINRGDYQALKMPLKDAVDEKSLNVEPVSTYEADAIRADVLARVGRTAEAETLANAVLREAPQTPVAHESMGWIKLREGDVEGARKWYTDAVSLHTTSFLAYYYAGSLALRDGPNAPESAAEDLREAIKLNPHFAPALESLAQFDALHNEKLDEALGMGLRASAIDPGNLDYRLNTCELRVQRKELPSAISGLKATEKLAHTPAERERVHARLEQVERYAGQMAQTEALQAEGKAEMAAEASRPQLPRSSGVTDMKGKALHAVVLKEPDHKLPDGPPSGPKHTVSGTIGGVGCFYPKGMTLQITGAGAPVALYSNDMYSIAYTAGNFTPDKDLNPCNEFNGLKATVTYAAVDDPSVAGQIIAMELNR